MVRSNKLTIRNRLKNIEATEKAKREMEERRRNETKTRRNPEDEDFAAARCGSTT